MRGQLNGSAASSAIALVFEHAKRRGVEERENERADHGVRIWHSVGGVTGRSRAFAT
jgi:hypothetical protein